MAAAATMLALSLFLFWLPVLGPLIAGFFGGRKVGSGTTALRIALLPALLTAVFVILILITFDLPVIGTIAGVGIFIAVAVQDIPLLIGAYVGAEA